MVDYGLISSIGNIDKIYMCQS